MRPKHTPHSLSSFPVYSCAFLGPNQLVLGGGGGGSKTGIKNKLALYEIDDNLAIALKAEFQLGSDEDAPMSMAAHVESSSVVCGVNSSLDKMQKGENENCRLFTVDGDKIELVRTKGTLTGSGEEDTYQKVTVLSPDGTLLAVAGAETLSLLSFPSLVPVAAPVNCDNEIYDAAFTNDTLIIATTVNLLVYALPDTKQSPSKKGKKKTFDTSKTVSLELKTKVDIPKSLGDSSIFRSLKLSPIDPNVAYTVVNTTLTRSQRGKSVARPGHVCKWNIDSWTMEKSRKVGDKGITCFDISADGRFLGYGSSDLSIGMLDAKTLAVRWFSFYAGF
ncbi:hypothetical protein BDQ17DRAFT_1424609 [Cyathus striatus]|nr:hypothetical protein BDQ17DRAFT_1424609 [Cyathus striatus]